MIVRMTSCAPVRALISPTIQPITAPQAKGQMIFFFFQAEDGIRDYKVTGVQTCALPIWAATASELAMYTLMFVLPLVGWGMLSAARYPIVLYGSVHLPFILPHSAPLYAVLRKAHSVLAYLFFFTFMAHLSAILFHTLIVRDGMLKRMAPWNVDH